MSLNGIDIASYQSGILVDPTTPGVSDSTVAQAKTNINQTAESIVKSQQDDMAEAIDATESEVRK